MKKTKLITFGLLGSLLVGMAAFAATPAQIYSDLTGITEEEAYELRQEGKTFGELAKENEVYDEFVDKMVEQKIALIEEKVEQGHLTREKADEFIANIKENASNCDPSNPQKLGRKIGLGRRKGNGRGACNGNGYGRRNGGRGLVYGRRAK
ncbi:hypothetical protein [Vallitalea sp.]|jgi:hypothetical protein|uniref:hypothetical protein n=1 Tax=Vallitalea sp. TaxID=1882829 RepID=UPI0025D1587E|nr:hypothetical protein [Vallitalea sp.]MCT4688166.1 hypothetical protein [Vallitalea sp.]